MYSPSYVFIKHLDFCCTICFQSITNRQHIWINLLPTNCVNIMYVVPISKAFMYIIEAALRAPYVQYNPTVINVQEVEAQLGQFRHSSRAVVPKTKTTKITDKFQMG